MGWTPEMGVSSTPGIVADLRSRLADAARERDEARKALAATVALRHRAEHRLEKAERHNAWLRAILGQVDRDPNFSRQCWPWRGTVDPSHGYGVVTVAGRKHFAHRIVYELFREDIPDGLEIDHLCRNRACVNPFHLEPVTRRENILRGEAPSAKNARKTHCYQGHEFTPENTYATSRGGRGCKACRRIWQRKYNIKRALKRAALKQKGA